MAKQHEENEEMRKNCEPKIYTVNSVYQKWKHFPVQTHREREREREKHHESVRGNGVRVAVLHAYSNIHIVRKCFCVYI